MKKIAHLLLVLSFTFPLLAKTPIIQLQLVNQTNEIYLPNVQLVGVNSNALIGKTSNDGRFNYQLKTDEMTIRFVLAGYRDTTITLRGKSREISIPLKPTAETTAKWESLLTIVCDSLNQKFTVDFDSVARFNDANNETFNSFLGKNVNYPTYAIENNIQGKVYVSFIVGPDGGIYCPKIVKGASPALNREALRVLQQMPKWIPAQKNNQPVSSLQSIPISFALY